jgi:hypothetical protein
MQHVVFALATTQRDGVGETSHAVRRPRSSSTWAPCKSALVASLEGVEEAVEAAEAWWFGGGLVDGMARIYDRFPLTAGRPCRFWSRADDRRTYAQLRAAGVPLPPLDVMRHRASANPICGRRWVHGEVQGRVLWDLLGPVGPRCVRVLSFGHGDFEKRACAAVVTGGAGGAGVPGEAPAPAAGVLAPLVGVGISVGGANQWDFEVDVFRKTRGAVSPFHTFDCTVDGRVPSGFEGRIHFHRTCLGARDELRGGRTFRTWESTLREAGLGASPAYVKLDIEGYEWGVISSILRAPTHLQPEQIAVELHYVSEGVSTPARGDDGNGTLGNGTLPSTRRQKMPGEIATWMLQLFTRGGYMLLDRRDNDACMHCTEILLGKVLCPPHRHVHPGVNLSQRHNV